MKIKWIKCMVAGLLNELIELYKPIVPEGVFGPRKTEYKYVLTTRANLVWKSGARQEENGEIVYNYNVTFTVRGYHHVDEFMRLKWNGKFYRILNAIPDRKKNQIVIDAMLVTD